MWGTIGDILFTTVVEWFFRTRVGRAVALIAAVAFGGLAIYALFIRNWVAAGAFGVFSILFASVAVWPRRREPDEGAAGES